MMKRLVAILLGLVVCAPVCFGTLSDADEAADGYLTPGEYDGSAFSLENNEQLFVMGGGHIR